MIKIFFELFRINFCLYINDVESIENKGLKCESGFMLFRVYMFIFCYVDVKFFLF